MRQTHSSSAEVSQDLLFRMPLQIHLRTLHAPGLQLDSETQSCTHDQHSVYNMAAGKPYKPKHFSSFGDMQRESRSIAVLLSL